MAVVARWMRHQDVVTPFTITLGTVKRWLDKQRYGVDLRTRIAPGSAAYALAVAPSRAMHTT